MEAKFSPEVKEVISNSREEALRINHDTIGVEHLILGLLRDNDNVAVKILKSLEINPILLRRAIENSMKDKGSKKIHDPKSLPLTKQAEKILKIMVLEAKVLKADSIGTDHLLLSVLKNEDNVVTQILSKYDVDYDIFKSELGFITDDIKGEITEESGESFEEESDKDQFGASKAKGAKPK